MYLLKSWAHVSKDFFLNVCFVYWWIIKIYFSDLIWFDLRTQTDKVFNSSSPGPLDSTGPWNSCQCLHSWILQAFGTVASACTPGFCRPLEQLPVHAPLDSTGHWDSCQCLHPWILQALGTAASGCTSGLYRPLGQLSVSAPIDSMHIYEERNTTPSAFPTPLHVWRLL